MKTVVEVECPTCKVAAGVDCVDEAGKTKDFFHPLRYDAALAADRAEIQEQNRDFVPTDDEIGAAAEASGLI